MKVFKNVVSWKIRLSKSGQVKHFDLIATLFFTIYNTETYFEVKCFFNLRRWNVSFWKWQNKMFPFLRCNLWAEDFLKNSAKFSSIYVGFQLILIWVLGFKSLAQTSTFCTHDTESFPWAKATDEASAQEGLSVNSYGGHIWGKWIVLVLAEKMNVCVIYAHKLQQCFEINGTEDRHKKRPFATPSDWCFLSGMGENHWKGFSLLS